MSDFDLNRLIDDKAYDEAAEAVRDELSGEGGTVWKRALAVMGGSRIREAVTAKFKQVDLIEAFARGWAKNSDIQEAAEDAAKDGASRFVRLGKFQQYLDLFPILTISAAGIQSAPVKLILSLDGEFEAVELALRNRHITEVGGGLLKLGAVLRYGPVNFFAGKVPEEFQLPAGKRFKEPGIRIAPGGTEQIPQ